MPAAYSYVRFSTKGKQEDGDSHRRQLENSRKWIASQKDVWEATNYETIEDLGVSAFKGLNLDKTKGGLGRFIEFCEEGKVPRGSYLILESLDRFSRADPLTAATKIRDLIEDYGLQIVTLIPTERITTKATFKDTFSLLQIVMELCAANSYSVILSDRLKGSWAKRKERAREGESLNTKHVPSWIELEIAGSKKAPEYKLTINREKAKHIKYIFSRITEGITQRQLVRELNSKFPPVARLVEGKKRSTGKSWSPSYVSKLLNDRRLLGEFQLFKKTEDGKLVPDGEPILEYFPRVLEDDVFYAAQAEKNKHKKVNAQKRNETRANLLRGLIVCGYDGYNMYLVNGRRKRNDGSMYSYSRLQSYGYKIGKSKMGLTIDYSRLEDLILDSLSELRSVDVQAIKQNSKKIKELNSVIAGIKLRLTELERRLQDDKYIEEFSTNLDMRQNLKKKLKQKSDELDEAQSVSPKSKKEILNDLKIFRPTGLTQEEKKNLYRKYAQIIPDIIQKITIFPYQIGTKRNAAFGFILLRSGKKRMFILDSDDSVVDTIYTEKNVTPIWLYTKDGHVFWESREDQEIVEIYASIKRGRLKNEQRTPNPFAVMNRLQAKNQAFMNSGQQKEKKKVNLEVAIDEVFAINQLQNTGTNENPTEHLDKEPIICEDGRERWIR